MARGCSPLDSSQYQRVVPPLTVKILEEYSLHLIGMISEEYSLLSIGIISEEYFPSKIILNTRSPTNPNVICFNTKAVLQQAINEGQYSKFVILLLKIIIQIFNINIK